jgi:N utilization substance protein A
MNRELIEAFKMIEKEKGISKETLIDAIESALTSAYKKDQKGNPTIKVQLDPNTGDFHIYIYKIVVMEVEDESSEISLEEAKKIDPLYKEGDMVEIEIFPKEFGRIAAQTAKQVVVQRIREAERSLIYDEFSSRVGDIITGEIRRFEQKTVFIDLGKTEAILPLYEQIPGEHYELGARIKTFLVEVKKGSKGPQIILSRAKNGLLKRLFEFEVPEVQEGIVEIKNVAREPGARSKVAVYSRFENVDPVGACVGAKGSRVQMIVRELKGEKIDIIQWDEDSEKFITRALSPAKVSEVKLLPSKKTAIVIVPDNQLSLAIGREGQNARLAARLTGWKIDIKSESQAEEAKDEIEMLLAEEETYAAQIRDWDEILPDEDEDEESIELDELVEDEDLGIEEEEEPESEEDYSHEPGEIEEEFVEEKVKKKKVKKAPKLREQDLMDELEEGIKLFKAEKAQQSEWEQEEIEVPEEESELVFAEEKTDGFTIGQLLSEELKKKFSLNEKEKKTEKKKGGD